MVNIGKTLQKTDKLGWKTRDKKDLTKCYFSVIMYKNQSGATTWVSDKDRCPTGQDSNVVCLKNLYWKEVYDYESDNWK